MKPTGSCISYYIEDKGPFYDDFFIYFSVNACGSFYNSFILDKIPFSNNFYINLLANDNGSFMKSDIIFKTILKADDIN